MESEIVISGMSGRFPDADNVEEFWDKLINKVDLVAEEGSRWKSGMLGLPKRLGQLKQLDKFDNLLFGVSHKQTVELDPQIRILMEVTYESIVDAGYHPDELKGKNIGVFIGNPGPSTDTVKNASEDAERFDGYRLLGYCQSLLPNRISYAFDFKGPSVHTDTACAAGATALYQAFHAIRRGDCDAAIVGAAVLHLRPEISLAFQKVKMISEDGKSKVFDSSADGYVRSEAIVSLFLQKSEDARRKYATIESIKTNSDGYKTEGLTYPSYESQHRLISEVLKECKLEPNRISYLEAHGTGTPIGDSTETKVITDIFCCDRKEPLNIGSVKSNIGHTEGASGLCGIVKVLLSMEKGMLPANLHLNDPIPEIKAFFDNQIKVITDTTPWNGEYAAVSCFGFGGTNVHAVLKRHVCATQADDKENNIPQLALYCGRTEESVRTVFENSIIKEATRDFIALLHNMAYSTQKLMPYRGYKLLGAEANSEEIKLQPHERRPVWYIFSGMGTQWPGMGKDLMQIKVFADSIRKSAEILKPYVPNLEEMVTDKLQFSAKTDYSKRSIIPAFVSIAAVQLALVDVLTELGIKPDGLIGHSLGELGCAYADGCFTAEHMLMSAYWRGKDTEDSDLIQGGMAAVGLPWNEALKLCPKGVYLACHNSKHSVTISGPRDRVRSLIEKLNSKNIFAREVNTCGYAYHCDYVLPIYEKLQDPMKKLILDPKPRSSRWISSSYPEDQWNLPDAKLGGANYVTHNLVSPVLFCEALQHVPKNAILIEIGPHQTLQAFLKEEVGSEAVLIGLMKKNTESIPHLLSSIGKMYISGLNPDIEKLYPSGKIPVPRNTPMISPLIKWDHSVSWPVHPWSMDAISSEVHYEIDPRASDHYLLEHCIDGHHLFPATAYIALVWKAFSNLKLAKSMHSVPISFKNITFSRTTLLSDSEMTKFTVLISKKSGYFEVWEREEIVCTGFVSTPSENHKKCFRRDTNVDKKILELKKEDIYKEFRLRGYHYGKSFQGLIAANLSKCEGLLEWNDNWITFLDSVLHCAIIELHERTLLIPRRIESLIVDPIMHKEFAEKEVKAYGGIPVKLDKETKIYYSGGVCIKNLAVGHAKRQPDKQIPLLEVYQYFPYIESSTLKKAKIKSLDQYINACTSISKKLSESCGLLDTLNGYTIADEATIDKYIKSDLENYVLLKCLLNAINNPCSKEGLQNLKNCASDYIDMRGNDILSQTLINEYPLRAVVDVVFENIVSKALKIVEITGLTQSLSSKIDDYSSISYTRSVSYSILHTKTEFSSKDHLPKNAEIIFWNNKSTLDYRDIDLFVLNYVDYSENDFISVLEETVRCLKKDGFILLLQRTQLTPAETFLTTVGETIIPNINENELEEAFSKLNLDIICKKSDSFASCLYLLKKRSALPFRDLVINITPDNYDTWINEIKDKMVQTQLSENSSNPERVWLVSEGCNYSGIIGLVNCLRKEPGGKSIRCVFIGSDTSRAPTFSLENSFYKNQLDKNLVMNVFKKGHWGSYRHIKCNEDFSKIQTEHAYLNVLTIGDLSSFSWIDSSLKYFTPTDNSVLCQVYYASLNFKDVLLANGRLPLHAASANVNPLDFAIGFEFSGRTLNGKRVMGMVSHKGLATTVATDSSLLWDVPDEWTLEEAASVPVVYATAYYALISRGKLKHGERVLIHSGSGGVGQAAISIALSMGCEVFVTVGSEEKKEFLQKKFPQLKDRNFSNSRDTIFEEDILHATNGNGVHVVLNSLAEDKFFASVNCLSANGRFLEIGKYDLDNNTNLGMALFLKNVSFHGVSLDILFDGTNNKKEDKLELSWLLKKGIVEGVVKPLNTTVYNHDQVEQAFRYMASGRHIGKVVLKIRDEEEHKSAIPSPITVSALPRTTFDPRKSYIIIGGLGGFGLELCQWLIDRGAKNVILTSRSGITTGYQKLCFQRWKKKSAQVTVIKLNATIMDEAREVLRLAAEHGPVGGIFNLALVLKDALMENQTVQNCIDVCEPKVNVTKNMDILARELCPSLDWFVCFSSAGCGRGNAGQSIYGYANSVMERICEDRSSEGLPGLAIQWGIIGEVGFVEEKATKEVINVIVPQSIASCFTVFDKFLQQSHPVVSSLVLFQGDENDKNITNSDILVSLCRIFGIKDFSSVNLESKLGDLGMDSLIAVEIRQYLERNFNLIFTISELQQLKLKDLKKLSEGKSADNIKTCAESDSAENVFGNFSDLSVEHLIPKQTMIHMNKITTGIPLIFLHPIESSVQKLQTLADLLSCPVYGIQSTLDSPSDSVESLAAWCWELVKSIGNPLSVINLVGYSFGTFLSFEMALQAERHPKKYPVIKNHIMLDATPMLFTKILKARKENYGDDIKGEEHQCLSLFGMMFGKDIQLDFEELENLADFSERIRYTADKIAKAYPKYQSEDILKIFHLYNAKVEMMLKYVPKIKLKSEVCLIKSTKSVAPNKLLSDVYDLNNVCEGKINTYTVEGDHYNFIQGDSAIKCVEIMTEILNQ